MSRYSTAEDFWAQTKRDENGCLVWTGRTDRKGYGRLGWDGRTEGAHRVAWMVTHGPIPEGIWVLHHCDNPPCCDAGAPGDPDSGCLYLGDHEQNVADKVARGRQIDGHRHGRAKLSTEQVEEIRRRYIPSSGAGRPDGNKDQLAAEFGLHPKYVYWLWKNRYRQRS